MNTLISPGFYRRSFGSIATLQRLPIHVLCLLALRPPDSATAAILAGSTHGGSSDAQPIVAISKQSVAEKRTGYVNVLIDNADVDPV